MTPPHTHSPSGSGAPAELFVGGAPLHIVQGPPEQGLGLVSHTVHVQHISVSSRRHSGGPVLPGTERGGVLNILTNVSDTIHTDLLALFVLNIENVLANAAKPEKSNILI